MPSPTFPPLAIIPGAAVSGYDVVIIVIYLLFLASMGWVFKRLTHGSKDYFAGGYRMTWWLLGASTFISNFSSWTFTGAANIAYTYGILVFSVYLIDVAGFLINYLWFAPRFRQLRLITAMDAVRLRFGRVNEQFFTWLGFLVTLGTAAVWLVSLAIILSTTFGFPPPTVILATGVVVVLIALFGGNWAVAASDFVQLLVLSSITIVVAVLTLVKVGGVGAFLDQVPETHWQFLQPAGSIPYDWIYIVTGLLSAIYVRNSMLHSAKYIAAKDGTHARRSALVPLIGYIVMPIIWFIPAMSAFTLAPNLAATSGMPNPGEAAYVSVCLVVLPQGLLGLMIVAMFAATISSMDIALNKSAGIFVKNFYQPFLRPQAQDLELLAAGRVLTVVFGCLITGLALTVVFGSEVSLFDAFIYINAYLAVPLAIPMFLGMIMRRVPPWAGWSTALFGTVVTIILYDFAPTALGRSWFEPWLGSAVYGYLLSNKFVITNLVGVPVTMLFFVATSLFYRHRPASTYDRSADEFFLRMRTPVDFEQEVGLDNTSLQAGLLGRIACLYAGFIVCLVAIPNSWGDRLAILGCAVIPLGVGLGLTRYAKRATRAALVRGALSPSVEPLQP